MPRHLVLKIIGELCQVEPQFNYQYDALNIRGHSPEQKFTSVLRILGYGRPPDSNDEYLRIGKTTAYKYLVLIFETMINHVGPTYLRKPTDADVREILKQNQERGFPEILGSLECMHWVWTGCPTYWAGSQNDINVLHKSPLFEDLKYGISPQVNFNINGNHNTHGCYLADGIYTKWSTLVQCYRHPPTGEMGRVVFKW
ncbi:uncharacterized protein LOC113332091 [Papaver somniferum]|uniref:uncharacterized protein LOC113332091 n=1 Tax=Papaver somniferum TaxID=3469 RepID=UPI000E6F7B50|nr:uncharacterized protein LOC113332091 [Papaver somniferum]